MTGDCQDSKGLFMSLRYKPGFLRWLLWIMAFLVVGLALSIILMLRQRGPSSETIAKVHRQYDSLRGRFPGVDATANKPATSAVPPSSQQTGGPHVKSNMTSESAQQRCDRLFGTILHNMDPGYALDSSRYKI